MEQKNLKTFDFSKVEINDLNGKPVDVKQLKEEFCKKLYFAGGDMITSMLGMKLWQGDGPVEINPDEEEVLRKEFRAMPSYLTRTALLKVLNGTE